MGLLLAGSGIMLLGIFVGFCMALILWASKNPPKE